jgi:hypothetical protein
MSEIKDTIHNLIQKHLVYDDPNGFFSASVKHYSEARKPSGSFYQALEKMMYELLAQPVPVKPETIDDMNRTPEYKALERLVFLKHYKDNHGKNDYYLREQPKAWKVAKDVVDDCTLDYGFKLLQSSSLPPVKAVGDWMDDIHHAYNDSWKSKDEVEYDAEGHPHYYEGMDYERKLDHETFGKSVEQIYLGWLEQNVKPVEGDELKMASDNILRVRGLGDDTQNRPVEGRSIIGEGQRIRRKGVQWTVSNYIHKGTSCKPYCWRFQRWRRSVS